MSGADIVRTGDGGKRAATVTFFTENLSALRMCFGSMVDATQLIPFAIDAPGGGRIVKGVVKSVRRVAPGRFEIESEETR